MLCGTEPHPTYKKARKYKLKNNFLTKEEFFMIMRSLPEKVPDKEIEEMFAFADKDGDEKLSFAEFQIMINPPLPPEEPKPRAAEYGLAPQVASPDILPSSQFASPILQSQSLSHHS